MYTFVDRHTGISNADYPKILEATGAESTETLLNEAIPPEVRGKGMTPFEAHSEQDTLDHIRDLSEKNKVYKTYIGKGYYGTLLPSVIRRNILENPGWYTAYTPYQAEISQGRMEAVMNFQTMVCDLTGMEIANASLLDESTAAAEAAIMIYRFNHKKRKQADTLLILGKVFEQTKKVLHTRLESLGLKLQYVDNEKQVDSTDQSIFGLFMQYPAEDGQVINHGNLLKTCKEQGLPTIVAADIMALTMLKSPGMFGADVVVGSTQRFGVPMGFGGPHAAYFATREQYKRLIPGRIIGITKDRLGKPALRLTLQTREQHIKRDKATSNICTSQVLLAVMASFYAVYHGPKGLTSIASQIHKHAVRLAKELVSQGLKIKHSSFFDTLVIETEKANDIHATLLAQQINVYLKENEIHISLDETTNKTDVDTLIELISPYGNGSSTVKDFVIEQDCLRITPFLQQKVFNKFTTETEIMRYMKRLERKDIALNHSMISLGSCTMKLNSATSMIPITWAKWANIHPMVPNNQATGYFELMDRLDAYLTNILNFDAMSYQPNSGAQGEYAGLLAIKKYLESKGESKRNICLIPASAHGTNPASASMAGMKIVVIKSNENGEIDLADMEEKVTEHANDLAAAMITYPSTHGVFEKGIRQITDMIHSHGGQVYMDGANLNAQVGFTSPYELGADVCHLNLHKTFSIPHGGGGPGVGSIGVAKHLTPFLPQNHWGTQSDHDYMMAAAPWGSALILLITYAYIHMLGSEGLKTSTTRAILNANYMKSRLEKHYEILYTNEDNRIAHEFIVDCRVFKDKGIAAIDIAKRLMDYGYHAPTMSFPVPNTLMIEPTESESLDELDRFIDTMIEIRKEINLIGSTYSSDDNPLNNAPHCMSEVLSSDWNHSYSRETASTPLDFLLDNKVWPAVARADDAYGDRNLMCSCDPIEMYV